MSTERKKNLLVSTSSTGHSEPSQVPNQILPAAWGTEETQPREIVKLLPPPPKCRHTDHRRRTNTLRASQPPYPVQAPPYTPGRLAGVYRSTTRVHRYTGACSDRSSLLILPPPPRLSSLPQLCSLNVLELSS